MKVIYKFVDLENVPAIYIMYGGVKRSYPAFVGETGDLKRRVREYLLEQYVRIVVPGSDSSVVVIPRNIERVDWWENEIFDNDIERKAAEI